MVAAFNEGITNDLERPAGVSNGHDLLRTRMKIGGFVLREREKESGDCFVTFRAVNASVRTRAPADRNLNHGAHLGPVYGIVFRTPTYERQREETSINLRSGGEATGFDLRRDASSGMSRKKRQERVRRNELVKIVF